MAAPPVEATSVVPEKERLAPNVIADGAAPDPVGLPINEDAAKFAILASVTALAEIVMTPVTYRVVGFLKRTEHEDYYDRDTNFTPFSLKD